MIIIKLKCALTRLELSIYFRRGDCHWSKYILTLSGKLVTHKYNILWYLLVARLSCIINNKLYNTTHWLRESQERLYGSILLFYANLRYVIKWGHSVRAQKSYSRSGEQSYPIDLLRWRARGVVGSRGSGGGGGRSLRAQRAASLAPARSSHRNRC